MKTILSTKILTSNQRQSLLDIGLKVVEKDFIQKKSIPIAPFIPQQNLLFTSQQAVKSIVEQQLINQPENYTVFCVGKKTKTTLEQAGFFVVAVFEAAIDLAEFLVASEYNNFDFFCGNRRMDTLPQRLQQAGKSYRELVVYTTVNQAVKIETPFYGILFFSPSAVESFFEKNTLGAQPCFCIGNTTATALYGITEAIYVAPIPSLEATLQRCIDYFKR